MIRNKRLKKCVVCGNSFRPFRTTERACSLKCAIEFGKQTLKNVQSGLQNFRDTRKKGNELQILIKSTTNIVHSYVRDRDKGLPCISCGGAWNSSFQAGHCFNKKQYNGIRFDLFNIHGQCEKCNMYDEGNYGDYIINLPSRIGNEEWKSLQTRARMCKRFPHKWTKHELKEIQGYINKKRKGLLF